MNLRLIAVSLVSVALCAAPSWAQLFAEGFNDSSANVSINSQADTAATYVDYSNLTRGALNFNLPEAPRQVAGSAPTSGIVLEANLTAGAAVGVNVIAGSLPLSFSGTYRMSYDVYLNLGDATNGTTEQLLWGIGTDNMDVIEARNTRAGGTMGTWGWLANENGYGTEDAAIFLDGDELADLGDTQTFEDLPFNMAFPCGADGNPADDNPDPPNGAPLNDWVQVDIDVRDNLDGTSDVKVYYNFVEFFSQTVATSATTGFAMLGYEDPFTSLNDAPDSTFGLFDNFTITANPQGAPTGTIPDSTFCVIPEPSTGLLSLLGLLAVGIIRRRR